MKRPQEPLGPLRNAADFFLNVLYPPRCMGCGAFPGMGFGLSRLGPEKARPLLGSGDFAGLLSGWLCEACGGSLAPVEPPFCTCCGEAFQSRASEDHLCGNCAADPPSFHSLRTPFFYEGALAEAIQSMKYGGRMELGRPLGFILMDAYLRHFAKDPPDLIMPVPLHPARLRRRGYNQVMLLLEDWPGVPDLPPIAPFAMERLRPTQAQASLDRSHRAANVRKAFRVTEPQLVKDKKILLVDDVYTTGATSRECAKTLNRAGAARVDVLAIARVAA